MNKKLSIKKGLDIKIEGAVANLGDRRRILPATVAITPDDFPGFLPKAEVKDGDKVVVGQALMHDKRDPQVKLVSPVTGTVKAVVRGERRKIERVVVEPDTEGHNDANVAKTEKLTTIADATEFLKSKGLWVMMRQRPYDIVPGDAKPRDIFVTGIDSAPLAVSAAALLKDDAKALGAAVELLSTLTDGKIYISRRKGELPDIDGAVMVDIDGPHPAGLVGTLIANIAPVNKGETVWTLDLTNLWRIGRAVIDGYAPTTTLVAVTGSEVKEPFIAETVVGADIKSLLEGDVKDDGRHHRIISGNVLTGVKESVDGYLHFPYTQLTVIPEGDDVDEFMGWASISPKKMSESRSFPGRFLRRVFNPDARLNGGKRAFIMSGEYDRYMPMDIMAEYLLKAIIGRDIEKMEQLGIYEVAPEDFALGEYADTSKLEAQRTVREGLDYLRKELE